MSQIDLSALRIGAPPPLPRRPLGPRLLAAAAIVLVAAVAATFVWPLVAPRRVVPMAPVRAVQVAGGATSATAEAVGWVEADPFPTIVWPLVAGRIESLDVLEGAVVTRGTTVVATLDSAALRAAHERAAAMVAEREAAHHRAQVAHELAVGRRRQNAEARLRAAAARAALVAAETRLAAARQRETAAVAAARGAAAALAGQQQLQAAGGSYPVALERARADADAAAAAAAAAAAETAGLVAEQAALRDAAALADQLAAAPVDLDGALAVAAAELAAAAVLLDSARVDLQIAARELGWTRVLAPVDGVVLKLLARPGSLVGAANGGIAELYDPQRLRARIDVPLDSIGAIHEGQEVEVTSQVLGRAVVRGVVQRLQHESDLLKNTLQVKIGLIDPPALLRPETLCRARFLAPAAASGGGAIGAFRLPRAAVRQGQVFVFDPGLGRARAVPVQIVAEEDGEVVVRGELSPTQRVVLVPVVDGERIEAERT